MFSIDKSAFGAFVATLRKEKGITQKELAEKLFVSDKAVSKWETGQSIPDVALLVPLAEILGVTVTELLECHRIEAPQPMAADQVEAIVKKAVSYQEAETEKRKLNTRWLVPYIICAVLATVQLIYLKHVLAIRSVFYSAIQTGVILSSVFGAYFCLLAKDKLPTFYDDNKISFYSDGPVRMNITGLNLNNSNWPHIVRYIRFWTLLSMVLFALVAALSFGVFTYLGYRFGFYLPEGVVSSVAILVILLFSLVIPVYYIGNKYQ